MTEQSNPSDVITALTRILEERRRAAPDSSYVASLYHGGLDRILKKIGEEAAETIIAAKNTEQAGAGGSSAAPDEALLGEVADLWFHSMVMLMHLGHQPAWVLEELGRRFGTSGLAEKASRSGTSSTDAEPRNGSH